jgi:hypothetical protein
VARAEIVVGAIGGTWIGLTLAPWVIDLAGFGRDRADVPRQPGGLVATVEKVLLDLGRPARDILARAAAPEVKERLKQETDGARQLGMFGAPSFVREANSIGSTIGSKTMPLTTRAHGRAALPAHTKTR